MSQPLLSVKQVAIRLALSETEVRGMLCDGLIPCSRVGRNGGRRRVSEEDLSAYLQRSRELPAGQKPTPATQKKTPSLLQPKREYSNLRAFGFHA
jgi:excisionase family DNA binding protein